VSLSVQQPESADCAQAAPGSKDGIEARRMVQRVVPPRRQPPSGCPLGAIRHVLCLGPRRRSV